MTPKTPLKEDFPQTTREFINYRFNQLEKSINELKGSVNDGVSELRERLAKGERDIQTLQVWKAKVDEYVVGLEDRLKNSTAIIPEVPGLQPKDWSSIVYKLLAIVSALIAIIAVLANVKL